ncbi:MAG: CDP-6-deoxy-delta-3,4-glucoseen reductase [Gammaproteobacteria bacterium]|jgi:CDP-4-dehydro-6-deoxyglucose reductase|nr:CDP-6-deoxy-delta-3,4-glucoseen reductase [Gammaproteobacteria bacterium]
MNFNVANEKTGNIFTVDESETLLDGALRQGPAFNYSCRSGSCGSCQAVLVSGEVDPGEFSAKALSATAQAAGAILLCQARAQSDLVIEAQELPAGAAIEIRTLPCRVSVLEKACHDVMIMRLKLSQNQSFDYLAGQYVDILLRDGRRRSFSVANAPAADAELELHVRRVPGGHFTGQVFEYLKPRDLLRLQGPYGTFFLRHQPQLPAILVAGGTGLAPIKAMLEQAFTESSRRVFHLFWGVRTWADLYLDREIQGWLEAYPNLNYTPVLSEPQEQNGWLGQTGWVHDTVLQTFPDLSRVEVYASGPPPMIEAIRSAYPAHGLPKEQLYFDSFEFSQDYP